MIKGYLCMGEVAPFSNIVQFMEATFKPNRKLLFIQNYRSEVIACLCRVHVTTKEYSFELIDKELINEIEKHMENSVEDVDLKEFVSRIVDLEIKEAMTKMLKEYTQV